MPTLRLDYFDGRRAAMQSAEISLADGQLQVVTEAATHTYAVAAVRWPERQRHGQRQVLLPDGGVLSCAEPLAWDAWARAVQLPESATVRWMQSWRHVAASLAVLVLLIAAGWRWGVPLAADATVLLMSPATEQRLGEGALAELDKLWLKPSALSAAEQQAITQRFAEAVARTREQLGPPPLYRLNFRAAHKAIGPNAFALPGGDIVLTDALAQLLADTPDALVGVLGHELGHLRHRHGLRQVVQAGIVGAAAGLLVGDFSALLAAAPAVLAESAYSRDFEREADEDARQLLRAAGISPRVMTVFFERAEKAHPGQTPIAIASHPATDDRIRFFSE